MYNRSFSIFVHLQGRGHARRARAIVEELGQRQVDVFAVGAVDELDGVENVRLHRLPVTVGEPSPTPALASIMPPSFLHCAPMGAPALAETAAILSRHFAQEQPGLFLVDVSVELAVLGRLCGVPTVSIRMHGDRNDAAHQGAMEASVAMIAPFDERLEQPDYPAEGRARTFYSGGLCLGPASDVDRAEARSILGIDLDRRLIVAMAGGGGSGAHFASLTVGARAVPDARWVVIGPPYVEGHETDFGNLESLGWVDRPDLWLAAANTVVASAGDNTVHEIARIGRPYLCIPDWRYFGEQDHKAKALARLGAAHVLPSWPGGYAEWIEALAAAETVDIDMQRSLHQPNAAARIARHLEDLDARLWVGAMEAAARTAAE